MPYPAEYEGKPQPGVTFSQRRAELDSIRFVAIRNMAYLHYQVQPDPNQPPKPLMTYNDSLALDRDEVKKIVLQFELQNGLVQPDGTEAEYFSAPTASAQQQGAAMATPPNQYPPPPPGYAQPGPAGGYQPPPPAPPGYAQPAPPPPPSPAAATAAATGYQPPPGPPAAPQYQPPQQVAPPPGPMAGEPPPAPKGRKRAQPQGGAGVAPPPAAPPPAPSGYQQPMAAPPPQYAPGPPAQQTFAAPPPVAQQMVPATPAFDPTPLMAAIDRIGGGLAATSKTVDNVQAQIAELRTILLSILMVQQWGINVDPSQTLAGWLKQSQFDVSQAPVTEFLKLLVSRLPR